MDAKSKIVKPWPGQVLSEHVRTAPQPTVPRPSREEAEAAVRTLIAYSGDDPAREGVLDTPKRVVDAYEEITVRSTVLADRRLRCVGTPRVDAPRESQRIVRDVEPASALLNIS